MSLEKSQYAYLASLLLKELIWETLGEDIQDFRELSKYVAESAMRLSHEERKNIEFKTYQILDSYRLQLYKDIEEEILQHKYDHGFRIGVDEYYKEPIIYNEEHANIWKKASREKKTVSLVYESLTSGITNRLVDPYVTRSPYVEGYCHFRKEVRKFRFDRIIDISLTNKKFKKRLLI